MRSAFHPALRAAHRPSTIQRTTLRLNRTMSSSEPILENTNINTAPGVTLEPYQKTLISSVLDLFAGRPSLQKLQYWSDDAVFEDPITTAHGRKEFEPQWYGLQSAFSAIERLSHEVTDGGNPVKMDMKTRYVVKGLGTEKVISSVVEIYIDRENQRIEKVRDMWNGELPEGAVANVSLEFSERGFRCANLVVQAFRRLNATTVPKIVSVPKNDEEDAKRGN